MSVTVYLVGAGPGEAGLITVRGRELIERADVVIYDYLANPELLELAPAAAERIYVGKKGFEKHITQEEINSILVKTARELDERGGSIVVRLKGGDPFLFGRGGEEALALVQAGIAFEVVPGVTSGIAATAYAGIPVTHRGLASSVTFVTGHEDPTKSESAIDWGALANLIIRGGTVCFYMGMRKLPYITAELMRWGVAGDMPAAVIQHGAGPRQRTAVSTIAGIADAANAAGLGAPSIIVVGAVAKMRESIAWFEDKPLFGKRIVVTRGKLQSHALTARLSELGANVLEFPTIEIANPDDSTGLDDAVNHLSEYKWLVFTSVNGVDAFFKRLTGDARALAGMLIAAIGPATAKRLAQHGIVADVMPDEYRGETVFAAIAEEAKRRGLDLKGTRVLIPRAQKAREALPELLREAGAVVDVVAAYKTIIPTQSGKDEFAGLLEAGQLDAITFTSPSTAHNLVKILGGDTHLLQGMTLCSIGPVTSAALRDLGIEPTLEAAEYTTEGMVKAMRDYYEED